MEGIRITPFDKQIVVVGRYTTWLGNFPKALFDSVSGDISFRSAFSNRQSDEQYLTHRHFIRGCATIAFGVLILDLIVNSNR